ncbi:HET-domain-containing protein [Mytilinidion resinicola]|uniref:HET-domain-containing protein n=1 Tax=Mytilinidion resinicola TaxID=574789 RepID=A0A6A6XZG4_9PEZI|nr:HET-domain-containing protein [Mytilinidion resinicola]KAF2801912.1 HET-domain-containing protein [Mytilinidion resinicola]
MRLLDTATVQLKEFVGNGIPPYAILSHTWEDDEVSLQALPTAGHIAPEPAGYTKIKKCCEQAASDGFQYVWIDTCCIDKTNSAKLSEAINSMYRWYWDAVECYAYLADVSLADLSLADFGKRFKGSRWFKRGWTLQELIAPRFVVFFDSRWIEIGTKASLRKEITAITGIPEQVLSTRRFSEYSIAQTMSWASKRQTSRVEDIAYSLLGLFDVNMPMIYGEGSKAFLRLQHEIMRKSSDQSLFAWNTSPFDHYCAHGSGPLAPSPFEFRGCGHIVRSQVNEQSEYSLTNRGLRITLPLLREINREGAAPAVLEYTSSQDIVYGATVIIGLLDCFRPDGTRIGIYLTQVRP